MMHPGRLVAVVGLLAVSPLVVSSQALDDGLMLTPRQLRVGVDYGRDAWSSYWEGSRPRTNDNLGTVRTESATWRVGYGVSRHLALFASLPYVWTTATQGVLSGMRGAQDLTIGAKLRLVEAPVGSRVTLRSTGLLGAGTPVSDYTPDFLPLSIGLGATRVLTRATVRLEDRTGVFAEASAGYQWRGTVTLDRPAYFTNNQLVLGNQVPMPDVTDAMFTVGVQSPRWCVPLTILQQRTLGGGDIRRQDMPFVSNRMDATRLQAQVMYTMPSLPVILNTGAMVTLAGRNVGRSTMFSGGVTYVMGR